MKIFIALCPYCGEYEILKGEGFFSLFERKVSNVSIKERLLIKGNILDSDVYHYTLPENHPGFSCTKCKKSLRRDKYNPTIIKYNPKEDKFETEELFWIEIVPLYVEFAKSYFKRIYRSGRIVRNLHREKP